MRLVYGQVPPSLPTPTMAGYHRVVQDDLKGTKIGDAQYRSPNGRIPSLRTPIRYPRLYGGLRIPYDKDPNKVPRISENLHMGPCCGPLPRLTQGF